MTEYLVVVAYLAGCYLLLQNSWLKSRKWFVYIGGGLALAIVTYFIFDLAARFSVISLLLVLLVIGGTVYTAMKRWHSLQKKKWPLHRQRTVRK